MGKAKLRRLLQTELKWVDKLAPRHKHKYCIPITVCLHMHNDRTLLYSATRCEHCNSFMNAKSIQHPLAEYQLHLYSPHDWIIGFADVTVK